MDKGARTNLNRKDISDPYWISDNRRKELESFCAQYGEFDLMRRALEAELYPNGLGSANRAPKVYSYEDKMASYAEVTKALNLIEKTVYELDPAISLYILLHVTSGYTFSDLCLRYGEIEKDIFDENLKKYFFLLSVKKGL